MLGRNQVITGKIKAFSKFHGDGSSKYYDWKVSFAGGEKQHLDDFEEELSKDKRWSEIFLSAQALRGSATVSHWPALRRNFLTFSRELWTTKTERGGGAPVLMGELQGHASIFWWSFNSYGRQRKMDRSSLCHTYPERSTTHGQMSRQFWRKNVIWTYQILNKIIFSY